MFSRALILSLLVSGASAFAPHHINTVSFTSLNLAVGETAPDFTLKDQDGKDFTRSKLKKPLVVYFYPADATPGCTIQAKSFNDQIKDIRKKYNAEVVGISGQGVASKEAFACDLGLGFPILADEKDVVRNAFKVPKALLGLFPGRVTYVLDKTGKCVSVYDNLADAASHVDVATEALSKLK